MSLRRAALSVFVGIPLALVATEVACGVARGWAFPHVNFYILDPDLGVRLAPGAEERISFSGNPVTTVRTNAQGYRGADWGPPGSPEVLFVGDSQAFGLGVEEEQTAASVLAAKTGKKVLNGAVPTYGPYEYLAVATEVAKERTLSDIVIVLNASNDYFEAGRPNKDRHGVWDGWAVRRENMPEGTTDFPGRAWLFSKSQAVFAYRAWRWGAQAPEAVPSEGTAADLLPLAAERVAAHSQTAATTRQTEDRIAADVRTRLASYSPKEDELELLSLLSYVDDEVTKDGLHIAAYASVEGKAVGDVVYEPFAESSRRITLTAEQLEAGAKLRREAPDRLRKWLATHPDDPYEVKRAQELLHRLDTRHVEVEAGEVAALPTPWSVLSDYLGRAQAVADTEGARLTVVLLPMDVQVSDAEWAKYGEAPIDMKGSLALVDEVAREADSRGIPVIQPLETLRAAEPGAFLDGDLHLSPKGQAALGDAIAASLTAPKPVPMPGPGLPEGRSRVPLPEEWEAVGEIVVKGSSKLGCDTRQVREWLRVRCADATGVALLDPAPLEAMTGVTPGGATLIAPVLPGRLVTADFGWTNRVSRLVVGDGAPRFVAQEGMPAPAPTPEPALSACSLPDGWAGNVALGCATLASCEDRLACASGTRLALPTCGVGEVNAGSAGYCLDRCDDAHPCAAGECTAWQGSGVCL